MDAEEEEALALLVVAVVGVEDLRWEKKNLINKFKIHKFTNVEKMRWRNFFMQLLPKCNGGKCSMALLKSYFLTAFPLNRFFKKCIKHLFGKPSQFTPS